MLLFSTGTPVNQHLSFCVIAQRWSKKSNISSNTNPAQKSYLILILFTETMLNNQIEVCYLLLEKGADINDSYKGTTTTPLFYYFYYDKNNEKMLQFLLSNGADPFAIDTHKLTANQIYRMGEDHNVSSARKCIQKIRCRYTKKNRSLLFAFALYNKKLIKKTPSQSNTNKKP
jgi:hypothetical protein